MPQLKQIGLGTILIINGSTVASVRNVSGPDASGDDVDTTTLDSTGKFRTFIRSLVDPGEVTFSLAYASTNTSHKKLGSLLKSGTVVTCSINDPSTSSTAQSFSGYCKGLSREIPLDDLITVDATFKVTGPAGYAST